LSQPQNLGAKVNSKYGEVHPIISPDGNTLYFTRKEDPRNTGGEGRDDIWFSKKGEDGKWTEAENMGTPLNSGGHTFLCAITPDGNTALVAGTYENFEERDKLYLASRLQQGWDKPKEINIENYYNLDEYNSFHQSVDGKTIIMSLSRYETEGAKDLYASFRQPDGNWSEPRNMGPDINTAGSEITPFLAPDGKSLYFASDGFSGYGSSDIFVSKRQDNTWTNWSVPQNIGPQVNTAGWDAFYSVEASGEYAYFTSYNNSMGAGDIFRVQLEEIQKPELVALVKGKVVNAETNESITAEILYELLSTGENAGFASSTPGSGEYQIVLPAGERYAFYAEARGYFSINENIDLRKIEEYTELERNIRLVPIKVGNVIQMNNIFFTVNKAEIKPESFSELNRIGEFLLKHSYLQIEIGGHTNNLCDYGFCLQLSESRAREVAEYLIEKGVEKEQVSYKGYGSKHPIENNATSEGRKANQRVEFKIVGLEDE
jgi:outer membrane protein OmpA-like peptidoglycan-associated protein